MSTELTISQAYLDEVHAGMVYTGNSRIYAGAITGNTISPREQIMALINECNDIGLLDDIRQAAQKKYEASSLQYLREWDQSTENMWVVKQEDLPIQPMDLTFAELPLLTPDYWKVPELTSTKYKLEAVGIDADSWMDLTAMQVDVDRELKEMADDFTLMENSGGSFDAFKYLVEESTRLGLKTKYYAPYSYTDDKACQEYVDKLCQEIELTSYYTQEQVDIMNDIQRQEDKKLRLTSRMDTCGDSIVTEKFQGKSNRKTLSSRR